MRSTRRAQALIAVLALLAAAAVGATARVQTLTAARATDEIAAAERLQVAMLDRETGLRGYLQTGERDFLAPYALGSRVFADAEARLRGAGLDPPAASGLRRAVALGNAWRRLAQRRLDSGDRRVPLREAQRRKDLMDRFRAAQLGLVAAITEERRHDQAVATWIAVGLSLGLSLVVGAAGTSLLARRDGEERRARQAEDGYRRSQAEFATAMQVAGDEEEAHALVRRHLERSLPGAEAFVLRRSGPPGDTAGGSCLATRLGRSHERGPGDEPLLVCERCGTRAERTSCVPLLVRGEVIGSVLVAGAAAGGEHARRRIDDSVAQAAPVLANLRTLELAESRAATDALTGLPNRRALRDTLARMAAHAGRAVQPLSAIAVDIDHFKQINDTAGHEKGDEALVAVAGALREAVRSSDFAARWGGEEFVVLCPDTPADGAAVLAEKLRAAVAQTSVPGLPGELAASFGVAALPQHAGDGDALLRHADGALYAAKAAGRNRVVVAEEAAAATAPVA